VVLGEDQRRLKASVGGEKREELIMFWGFL